MRLAAPFLVRNHVGPGILKVSMCGNEVFMVETTASARIRSKSEPEEAKLTAITRSSTAVREVPQKILL